MSGDEGYGADGGFGWSGSDTSKERAEDTGRMQRRMNEVLAELRKKEKYGATSREMENSLDMGHGPVSAALSHLHKGGHIKRLTERRGGRAQVYVHPDYVNGREEAPFRPNRANRDDYVPTPLVTSVTREQIHKALVSEELPVVWGPWMVGFLTYAAADERIAWGRGRITHDPADIGEHRVALRLRRVLGFRVVRRDQQRRTAGRPGDADVVVDRMPA